MKTLLLTGEEIKLDNGSGYSLSQAFPKRKFHRKTVYQVRYNGISVDHTTVVSILRARKGWEQR